MTAVGGPVPLETVVREAVAEHVEGTVHRTHECTPEHLTTDVVAAVRSWLAEEDVETHEECSTLLEEAARRIEAVQVLMADPWHGDAHWEAVHHTGVSRRGALRGGDFVAVEDLRGALTRTATDEGAES